MSDLFDYFNRIVRRIRYLRQMNLEQIVDAAASNTDYERVIEVVRSEGSRAKVIESGFYYVRRVEFRPSGQTIVHVDSITLIEINTVGSNLPEFILAPDRHSLALRFDLYGQEWIAFKVSKADLRKGLTNS